MKGVHTMKRTANRRMHLGAHSAATQPAKPGARTTAHSSAHSAPRTTLHRRARQAAFNKSLAVSLSLLLVFSLFPTGVSLAAADAQQDASTSEAAQASQEANAAAPTDVTPVLTTESAPGEEVLETDLAPTEAAEPDAFTPPEQIDQPETDETDANTTADESAGAEPAAAEEAPAKAPRRAPAGGYSLDEDEWDGTYNTLSNGMKYPDCFTEENVVAYFESFGGDANFARAVYAGILRNIEGYNPGAVDWYNYSSASGGYLEDTSTQDYPVTEDLYDIYDDLDNNTSTNPKTIEAIIRRLIVNNSGRLTLSSAENKLEAANIKGCELLYNARRVDLDHALISDFTAFNQSNMFMTKGVWYLTNMWAGNYPSNVPHTAGNNAYPSTQQFIMGPAVLRWHIRNDAVSLTLGSGMRVNGDEKPITWGTGVSSDNTGKTEDTRGKITSGRTDNDAIYLEYLSSSLGSDIVGGIGNHQAFTASSVITWRVQRYAILSFNDENETTGGFAFRKSSASNPTKEVVGAEYAAYSMVDGILKHVKDMTYDETYGLFTVDGLAPGTYYIIEKTAAPGYQRTEGVVGTAKVATVASADELIDISLASGKEKLDAIYLDEDDVTLQIDTPHALASDADSYNQAGYPSKRDNAGNDITPQTKTSAGQNKVWITNKWDTFARADTNGAGIWNSTIYNEQNDYWQVAFSVNDARQQDITDKYNKSGETKYKVTMGRQTWEGFTLEEAANKINEITENQALTDDITVTSYGSKFTQKESNYTAAENVVHGSDKVLPVFVPLTAKKNLLGGTLAGNDFTFELSGSNIPVYNPETGEVEPTGEVEKKNDANGKVDFGLLYFDGPGTYTYTLKEKEPVEGVDAVYDPKMTCDTAERTVKFVVTELNGKEEAGDPNKAGLKVVMIVTKTVNGQEVTESTQTFYSTQTAEYSFDPDAENPHSITPKDVKAEDATTFNNVKGLSVTKESDEAGERLNKGDTVTYKLTVTNPLTKPADENLGEGETANGRTVTVNDTVPTQLTVTSWKIDDATQSTTWGGSAQVTVPWAEDADNLGEVVITLTCKVTANYDTEDNSKNLLLNQASMTFGGETSYTDVIANFLDPQVGYIMEKKRIDPAPQFGTSGWYGFMPGAKNMKYIITIKNTGELPLTMDVSDSFDAPGASNFENLRYTEVSGAAWNNAPEGEDAKKANITPPKITIEPNKTATITVLADVTENAQPNLDETAPDTTASNWEDWNWNGTIGVDNVTTENKHGYQNTATTTGAVSDKYDKIIGAKVAIDGVEYSLEDGKLTLPAGKSKDDVSVELETEEADFKSSDTMPNGEKNPIANRSDIAKTPVQPKASYQMKKERVSESHSNGKIDERFGFFRGNTVTYEIKVENTGELPISMTVSDAFDEPGNFKNIKYTEVTGTDVTWDNESASKNTDTAPEITIPKGATATITVTADVSETAKEWLAVEENDVVPERKADWTYTDASAVTADKAAANTDGYVNTAKTTDVVAKYTFTDPNDGQEKTAELELSDKEDYANTPVQLRPSYVMDKVRVTSAPQKIWEAIQDFFGFKRNDNVEYRITVTNTGETTLTMDVKDEFAKADYFKDLKYTAVSGEGVTWNNEDDSKDTDTPVNITIEPGKEAKITVWATVTEEALEFLSEHTTDDGLGYLNTATTYNVESSYEDHSGKQVKEDKSAYADSETTNSETNPLTDRTDTANTPVQVNPSFKMMKSRVTPAPAKNNATDEFGFFRGNTVTYEIKVENTGDIDLTMTVTDEFVESGNFKAVKIVEVADAALVSPTELGNGVAAEEGVKITVATGKTATVTVEATVTDDALEWLAPKTDDVVPARNSNGDWTYTDASAVTADKAATNTDGYVNIAKTKDVEGEYIYTDENGGVQTRKVTKTEYPEALGDKDDYANTPVQEDRKPDYEMSKERTSEASAKTGAADEFGFFRDDTVTYEVTVENTGKLPLRMSLDDVYESVASTYFDEITYVKVEGEGVTWHNADKANTSTEPDFSIEVGKTATIIITAHITDKALEKIAPAKDDDKNNPTDGYVNTATVKSVKASYKDHAGTEKTYSKDDYDELKDKSDDANTPVQETVKITVTKTWDDADIRNAETIGENAYARENVTFTITASPALTEATAVDGVTFTDGATATFTISAPATGDSTQKVISGLPKYAGGTEVTYTVTENVPDGFKQTDATTNVVISNTNEGKGSATNAPDSRDKLEGELTITVKKVDGASADKAVLAGAEFTLTPPEGSASEPVVLVTGEDGTATFTLTEVGTYTLKETKAPEGYKLGSTEWKIETDRELASITKVTEGEGDEAQTFWQWLGQPPFFVPGSVLVRPLF